MSSKTEIKLELAFPFDITIIPTVNGGCIVNVGCARLSYSTPARMLIDLKKYLADPKGYEKAYNECNKPPQDSEVASNAPRPSLTRTSREVGQVVEQLETAPDGPMSEGQDDTDNRRDPADHPEDRQRREGDSAETGGSPGDDR